LEEIIAIIMNVNVWPCTYRLASGGASRTNDQQTLLTLHLISGALKSLLRPSDLSSLDKGPAESLSGEAWR